MMDSSGHKPDSLGEPKSSPWRKDEINTHTPARRTTTATDLDTPCFQLLQLSSLSWQGLTNNEIKRRTATETNQPAMEGSGTTNSLITNSRSLIDADHSKEAQHALAKEVASIFASNDASKDVQLQLSKMVATIFSSQQKECEDYASADSASNKANKNLQTSISNSTTIIYSGRTPQRSVTYKETNEKTPQPHQNFSSDLKHNPYDLSTPCFQLLQLSSSSWHSSSLQNSNIQGSKEIREWAEKTQDLGPLNFSNYIQPAPNEKSELNNHTILTKDDISASDAFPAPSIPSNHRQASFYRISPLTSSVLEDSLLKMPAPELMNKIMQPKIIRQKEDLKVPPPLIKREPALNFQISDAFAGKASSDVTVQSSQSATEELSVESKRDPVAMTHPAPTSMSEMLLPLKATESLLDPPIIESFSRDLRDLESDGVKYQRVGTDENKHLDVEDGSKASGPMVTKESNSDAKSGSKHKKGRPKYDPSEGRPKRPLSAYNLFFRDQREKLIRDKSKEHLDANPDDVFEQNSEVYTEPGDQEDPAKEGKRKRGRPRGPNYKPQKAPHYKITFQDLAKEISKAWNTASTELLEEYKEKAAAEMIKYRAAMSAWKEKKSHSESLPISSSQDVHFNENVPKNRTDHISGVYYSQQHHSTILPGFQYATPGCIHRPATARNNAPYSRLPLSHVSTNIHDPIVAGFRPPMRGQGKNVHLNYYSNVNPNNYSQVAAYHPHASLYSRIYPRYP